MIYGTIQNFGDCFVVSNAFILNNKGEKIYDSFDGISVSSQGYPYKSSVARVTVKAEDFTESSPHVYYGIVNGGGKMALAPEYDIITDLGDGVLYAVKDGKAAFYNYDGNKITDINQIISADMFIDNTYVIIKRGKKNYYVGKKI